MNLPSSTAEALTTLASEGGPHDSLNAYFIGGGALAALLLLLWITTRLNRDR
ncbi:hypothetical protein H7827_20940 [Streptomyces sp. JH002]|jgi:hypothetical protein|uniref:Membrane protein n=1 Tax=Streptomyces xiamenensis TaxID=408015 RepID=A0A0F7FT84_9ACTN|nr:MULTISPECIES: hypothetical protein [Streptomyces]AKG42903.1 membrane protein [Streptomyces xiamenensis]MCU4745545.1 hypothetical protein [Streptomyces sp. G-5]QQN79455.1 hypothetical protein IPZ77_20040 [Streptomyces sp. XC 2026]